MALRPYPSRSAFIERGRHAGRFKTSWVYLDSLGDAWHEGHIFLLLELEHTRIEEGVREDKLDGDLQQQEEEHLQGVHQVPAPPKHEASRPRSATPARGQAIIKLICVYCRRIHRLQYADMQ